MSGCYVWKKMGEHDMNVRMLLITVAMVTLGACTTGGFRVLDREVLGATFVVCESKVSWQNYKITVEGLEGNIKTKTFELGKLGVETTYRQVEKVTLTVDRLFEQMCQGTIALRDNPKALADYVTTNRDYVLQVMKVLSEMEKINKDETDAARVVARQQQLEKTMPK